jgi:sensor histidine kinase YesM
MYQQYMIVTRIISVRGYVYVPTLQPPIINKFRKTFIQVFTLCITFFFTTRPFPESSGWSQRGAPKQPPTSLKQTIATHEYTNLLHSPQSCAHLFASSIFIHFLLTFSLAQLGLKFVPLHKYIRYILYI